jgi:alpha-methylacyl-CoA racemase
VLADLGADVVKIEDPALGDYLREISPGMYAALNRGKRSACIDLKSPEGVLALRRLCASADVLVEGFRPGVLARLGLDFAAYPSLIVCSISGYGQTGPWRDRAGHDIGYIALSGVLSRCRTLPGVQVADFFGGGQQAVVAVLAALYERERTGRGRYCDVASEGSLGFVLPYVSGEAEVLLGEHPCYRVYACRGGGRLALGALEPKFWARFCAAVSQPAWVERQFELALTPVVDALFLERTRDEWDAFLKPFDCCSEAVLEVKELAAHPLMAARELFIDGLLRTLPALVPTGSLPRGAAPTLGQHTAEILSAP